MKRPLINILTACVVLAFARSLVAQPLIDYVPEGAVLYAGWQGTASLGNTYDGSRLAALVNDPALSGSVADTIKAVRDVVEKVKPEAKDVFAMLDQTAPAMARAQWAVFVDAPADNPQATSLRILAKPADDADKAKIAEQFAKLVKEAPKQWRTDTVDGLLALTFMDEAHQAAAFAGKPAKSLAGSKRLAAGLAGAPGAPVGLLHMDGDGLLDLLTRVEMAEEGRSTDMAQAKAKMKAMGLDGLHAVTVAVGFAGHNWYTHAFIEAPAPRQGSLASWDIPALSDKDLEPVPASAVAVTAFKLDLTAWLDTTRKNIEALGGKEALQQFNAQASAMSMIGNVNVEKDVVGSLGSTWIFYTDANNTVAGIGLGGCLINALKDPAQAQKAVESLVALVNDPANGPAGSGPNVPEQIQVNQQQGVKCYTYLAGVVAPTLAIADGRLYVSVSPLAVFSAIEASRHPDRSLVKSEKYQAVVKRLGGQNGLMFQFFDLPASAQQMYQAYMLYVQLGSTAMAAQGLPQMMVMLPPLEKIMPQLAPSGAMSWADPAGLHMLAISPFPGANLLSPQGILSVDVVPVAVAGIIPGMYRAREDARQMQGLSQIRELCMAELTFTTDYKDALPNDIAVLVKDYLNDTAKEVLDPSSGKTVPADYRTWPQDKKDQWVRKNASYILIPFAGKSSDIADAAKTVAIFLNPADAKGDLVPVAYLDGHCQMKPPAAARLLIENQTGRTLEDLVKRQQDFQRQALDNPKPVPTLK